MASRGVIKRRATITDLPLYFSGQIQKKYTGEGGFRGYYGELRGSTMFFYADEKHETYCERLELHNLKSMVPVSSYSAKTTPVYTLTFSNQEVQLKADNPDTGELWRGYILTVAKLEVPHQLQLLPGHFMALEHVRDQEQQRQVLPPFYQPSMDAPAPRSCTPTSSEASNEYDDSLSSVPTCFMSVSREEAEELLTKNPECGSIILRPATDKYNYTITMRQIYPSGPVIKNYRILSSDHGFIIELEVPVTVQTLNQVVDYFLEQTAGQLKPFAKAYDIRIEVPPRVPPNRDDIPRVAPTIRTEPSPSNKPPTPPRPPFLNQMSTYENEKDLKTNPKVEKNKKSYRPFSRS
ncbi:signal-transducing adaptor protein 1-like [Clupea harengus]|uniref:Signal-transducing adaptor protein 1-like n=1 Tax=Clupea harengus TaxID=7950 RepID=A0A8M1KFT7_CLUHA|nr:signal-transducing adaptor protein 1-like [Clupea harengus]